MMKKSESVFIEVRGLRYHCRVWGAASDPLVVLLHGWMDVSASFQFVVDALRHDWYVVAPDWRGFGLSQWSGDDAYWFPDYLGDLDAILRTFATEETAVRLCGHSMGGNVACVYAGARPGRVSRLMNLEGFGLASTKAAGAPSRYARWLSELQEEQRFRDYADFSELAQRLQRNNAHLNAERAAFLAQHWGEQTAEGRVRLRSDPAHKRVNPVQYQSDEARACWQAVTAPVLWVEGAHSRTAEQLRLSAEEVAARKSAFANLRAVVIPGAGHMLHLDQPEALARVMEEFLLDRDD
jgi:pimeloyl-ACP methyl ester carboxylesterase